MPCQSWNEQTIGGVDDARERRIVPIFHDKADFMLRFIARFAIGVGGFWLAQRFVPGIGTDGWTSLVIAALLLGLANAIIRPVVVFITFPLTLLTLGLFLLVVNAAMLGLVAWVMPGLSGAGFVPAILGAIVIGVCSWIGDQLLREPGSRS